MPRDRSVLFIGLDPGVVDYARWPGLSPEKLRAALDADRRALEAEGYRVDICFIDRGETATAALRAHDPACVMIGAGVRTDAEHFLLFERLINVVHAAAPGARLCFNTGPTDSAAAVRRWI